MLGQMVSPSVPIKCGNATSLQLFAVETTNMDSCVVEASLGIFKYEPLLYVEGVWNSRVSKSVASGLIAKSPDIEGGATFNSSSNISKDVARSHIEPLTFYGDEEARKDVDVRVF